MAKDVNDKLTRDLFDINNMSSDDYVAWCNRLDINPEKAAKVLGISRANSFKYANGSQTVSKNVAYQCELFDNLGKKKSLTLIQKRLA